MALGKRATEQQAAWVATNELPKSPGHPFYKKLNVLLAKAGFDTGKFPPAYVKAALDTCKGKKRLFSELADYGGFYFVEKVTYDAEAAAKDFTPENRERLKKFNSLPPDKRQQAFQRMEFLSKLTPQQALCCWQPGSAMLRALPWARSRSANGN